MLRDVTYEHPGFRRARGTGCEYLRAFAVLGHDFRPRHIHINRLGHGRRDDGADEAAARQVCRRGWRRRAPAFLCCWCCGQAADLRPQQGRAAQREHRWSSFCAAMASDGVQASAVRQVRHEAQRCRDSQSDGWPSSKSVASIDNALHAPRVAQQATTERGFS